MSDCIFMVLMHYRPDFLLPIENPLDFKICEINARFSLNGYLIAHFGHSLFYKLCQDSPHQSSFKASIMDTLFSRRFTSDSPIYILKSREKGMDIQLLLHLPISFEIICLDPFVSEIPSNASQFILELHQDEILQLPTSLLNQLIHSITLNPLYSIFLLHDKRLLSFLIQESSSLGLDKQEQSLLKSHIVPTYLFTPSLDTTSLSIHSHEWVIKSSFEGKGVNMTFGKNISLDEWNERINHLKNQNSTDYILQKYIKQAPFTIKLHGVEQVLSLIGTFFCVDHLYFGVSVWRAGVGDIVAVSRGGCWMIGLASSNAFQNQKQNTPDFLSIMNPSETTLLFKTVFDSLKTNGYLFIKQKEHNPDLLERLGFHLGIPDIHSNHGALIWDVKQKTGSPARSHALETFDWHTDSSFEDIPPKYVILEVVHPDTLGGGLFRIVESSHILSHFTPQEITILQESVFQFKRPIEFTKDGKSDFIGPINSTNLGIFRYRSDTVTASTEESQRVLEKSRKIIQDIVPLFELELEKGMILILDNHRFLHARTRVLDKNRWLRRMRINSK